MAGNTGVVSAKPPTPAAGTGLPNGTVELLYNGSVIGTATVRYSNGIAYAQFTVQFSAYGDYTFTTQIPGILRFSGELK